MSRISRCCGLELAAALRAALRAEPHEQLRAAAQQWEDRARSPGLLWGRAGYARDGARLADAACS